MRNHPPDKAQQTTAAALVSEDSFMKMRVPRFQLVARLRQLYLSLGRQAENPHLNL
jgi:hypothetical protein